MADGLLMTAIKAKHKRKFDLEEATNTGKPANDVSVPSELSTSTPTATNPKGVTKLTPAEASDSLAKARARQKQKIDAAKNARGKANQRRKSPTFTGQ